MQPTFLLPWGANTIFRFDLHHIQMDATHIVVVMEVNVECMCSSTNAIESQGKYIHEQTIDNE
jgi:hypothetical protein